MEGDPSRSCAGWNSNECREELRASERRLVELMISRISALKGVCK